MSPLPPTRDRPLSGPPAGSPFDQPGIGGGEPPRRGRRWLKRVGIVFIVLLAVVLGAFAALAFVAKQEIDDLVTAETAAERATQTVLEKPLPGEATNILVLGSDHRTGTGDDDRRSDTMLLVRMDPKKKTISMLSFPRDLWVDIPGHGQGKINDAYGRGGAQLSVKTLKQLTDIDVNFVVDVDFLGFVGVVDALSGIWVDVDRRYFTPPEADHMEIDVQAGYQRLDGRDALAFARYRHDDVHGDFARIARQQQVLAGLKKQVASEGVRSNVPGLFRVMKKNTSIVAGGGDEVSARVIYDYMRLATSLSSKDVYQIEFEGSTGESSTGASIVTFEEAKLEGAVEAFLNPSASARESTADQLVGKAAPDAGDTKAATKADSPAAALPPQPSSVTVTVKNGSGVTGVARKMGEQLRNVGYQATVPDGAAGSADNPNYANTRVQYATASAKAAAEALADHIPGASAEAKTPANAFDTQLLVIVGDTGTEYRAGTDDVVGVDGGPSGGIEYSGNKVPDKAAAKTTPDAEYGRDDFATVGTLAFPLLYPTVREQTSTYEEVRAYEVIKGKARYAAFRMVAKTGQGDYWGLQGTNWPDPPVLEGATREVTRGTRRYQLFFNGTKLHMVAWKQGTGTYWVSNSVLDKLSNETMLAIADGIKPYA